MTDNVNSTREDPFIEFLRQRNGKKVVIICPKFHYWGILSESHGGIKPFVVLTNARCLEIRESGQDISDASITFPNEIMISIDKIENMFDMGEDFVLGEIPDAK